MIVTFCDEKPSCRWPNGSISVQASAGAPDDRGRTSLTIAMESRRNKMRCEEGIVDLYYPSQSRRKTTARRCNVSASKARGLAHCFGCKPAPNTSSLNLHSNTFLASKTSQQPLYILASYLRALLR